MLRNRFGPLLSIALVLGLMAGCNSSDIPEEAAGGSQPTTTVTVPAPPADPDTVTVDASTTTTMELGDGARLIIPPGSITDGARVHATYQDQPAGDYRNQRPLAAPVHLTTEPADAMRGLVTFEFPAPKGVDGGDLGISTLDEHTGAWTPVQATYDPGRRMIIAQASHFSWWNPFSWDWTSILASVNQGIGEVVGKRAPQATCPRGIPVPDWVSSVAGVTNDPAIAIRSCTEGEDGNLVVEMVNNRPYSMYLDYGSSVEWGWHEEGTSAEEIARNELADRWAGPNQLYLPPLGRASVGIQPVEGHREFRAGFGWKSFTVDALLYGVGPALSKIPAAGPCLSALFSSSWGEFSAGKVADGVRESFSCVVSDWRAAAAVSGELDAFTIEQLESMSSRLGLVGFVLTFGDIEWRLLDLFVDGLVVADSGLGAGFSVLGRSTVSEPPPTVPPPPGDDNGHDPSGPDPTSPPAPDPSPPHSASVEVYNMVTNGSSMREDTPAYLSTVTHNFCRRDGCMLSGTEMGTGTILTAVCVTTGDRTTNGQDNSTVDDANPSLYTSSTWYGIAWPDGRFGYLSEVWIAPQHRGGLGLRSC